MPPTLDAVEHVDPLAAGEAVRLGVVVIHALRRGGQDHRHARQLGGHAGEGLAPVAAPVAEYTADVLAEGDDLAGQEPSSGSVDLLGDVIGPVRQTWLVGVVPHDRGGSQSWHRVPGQRETPGVVAANRAHRVPAVTGTETGTVVDAHSSPTSAAH